MGFRIVVLVSGKGTLLQAVLDAAADGSLEAEVVAVVADRESCQGLERASAAGVPAIGFPLARDADRQLWDRELTGIVDRYDPDLVVSAGFMKLLGAAFLDRFGGRTINTHPALLPSFPGMHAPRDAIEYGVKVSGATVFLVDEGVDTGKILAQQAVPLQDGDTAQSLHDRIKIVERQLLVETLQVLVQGRKNGCNVD